MIKTLLQQKNPSIIRGTAISKNAALLLVLFFLTASCLAVKPAFSSAEVAEDFWVSKEPMPSTLNYPKATMLNGKIYVVGAHYGENVNNSLFEYDPVTDNWTVRKSMPSSRLYFAVAACNNKIYVIGGGLNPQESYAPDALSTNEVYDPVTDTWETKASMPTARWGLVAETVNDKIYLISGRTGGGKTSVKVNEVYDPNTDSWTNASSIPTPVCGPASAVVDNRIYVIGGQAEFNDPMNPGLNQIYDPETDTWVQGAKEPNPAWSAAAAGATTGAMAPKMIYVMGGVPGFAPPFDQNYAYNPKEDGWIIAASLPAPKSSFAVAVVNDLVYVIGGTSVNYGVITASVEQYTPIGYETSDPSYDGTAPEIAVLSPENKTYYTANVTLSFTVNEPVSSMHYELDGETAVEISGNTTIARLAIGVHNITVSAVDAAGNMGVSETVTFTIAKETEAFPIRLAAAAAIVIAAIVLVAAVSIGLSVYLKKRK